MNVPNTLTMLRIVFSIGVFCCLPFEWYWAALALFILASLTDFLDGWWARKFNQITVFGRIMDPFADKFLICGVFIGLLAVPAITGLTRGIPACLSFVPDWLMLKPWMVIVIVARELLVTSLRAVVESSGGDFSAKWIGKWKMGFQCFAVIAALLYLAGRPPFGSDAPYPAWAIAALPIMLAFLWLTVLITVYSGVVYCVNAARMINAKKDH